MYHQYKNPPFNDPNAGRAFQIGAEDLMQILGVNVPGGHAHGGDDLITCSAISASPPTPSSSQRSSAIARTACCGRGCGASTRCAGPPAPASTSRATSSTSASTYGKTVDIVRRYCNFATTGKKWWLYRPVRLSTRPSHPTTASWPPTRGPGACNCSPTIRRSRSSRHAARTLHEMPDKVAFVQVDLNAAQVELDRLAGDLRPHRRRRHDRARRLRVLSLPAVPTRRRSRSSKRAALLPATECPTGQGIVIKRR